MSDSYMPDQISVRLITATGSEEEGWEIFWLTPCACIDPISRDDMGLCVIGYFTLLESKLPWLKNIPTKALKWDEYNRYGQIIDWRDGKPILELVGENVG